MIAFEKIAEKAESLLKKADAFFIPPSLEKVLSQLRLSLDERPLEDEYSGLLILGKKSAVVVINSQHPPTRRRFTMAHEIGHYVLHKSVKETHPFFIDKAVTYFRRDNNEEEHYDREKEIEANAFAAELLMPRQLLKNYIEENNLDISEQSGIRTLAQEFEVSQRAMEYRLRNTGLIMHLG